MNRLQEIFEKQRALLISLKPVYEANGFSSHNRFPYPLSGRWSQEEFRLLAWRITEEVYEALDSWKSDTVAAYREEVADVLHFFVELCICADITPGEIGSGKEGFSTDADLLSSTFLVTKDLGTMDRAWEVFLIALAKALMLFRQRPWRTDNRVTDRKALVVALSITWYAFVQACVATDITDETLYRAYFLKGEINDQRVVDAKAGIP